MKKQIKEKPKRKKARYYYICEACSTYFEEPLTHCEECLQKLPEVGCPECGGEVIKVKEAE